MNKLKKKFSKPLIFIIVLYLLTRIINLTLLPIFNDEAIYLYWVKLIATTNHHWFINLTDGKPPILIWAMVFFMKILSPSQYLLAGRIPEVITGLISLLGIYSLSEYLFKSKKTALLTAFFYIICPFALFYDRIGLFDSFLSSMLIWSVYFALKTSKSLDRKDALLWGFFLGMGFLAKINALLFLFLTPVSFSIFMEREKIRKNIKKISIALFIAIAVSQLLRFSLIVSHGYHEYVIKSTAHSIPLSSILAHPLSVFPGNFSSYVYWFTSFVTIPLFILGVIGFILLFKNQRKIGVILIILLLIPVFGTSFASQIAVPRYILYTLPYFLIAAGYAGGLILKNKILTVILALVLIIPIYFDFKLLLNPSSAPLPDMEKSQYVTFYSSGYGLDKVFAFLRSESEKSDITVVTIGTTSIYPESFLLEFWGNPRVHIIAIWPTDKNTKQKIKDLAKNGKVFVVLKYKTDYNHPNFLKELDLKQIFISPKPDSNYPIIIAVPK